MANISHPKQTTKNDPPESGISVDSLKVRIPLGLVEVLEPSLTSKWFMYNEDTGEVDPEYFKQNSLTRHIDKAEIVKVRFGIEKQRTEHQTIEEYLTILLPAKVLGARYFEGITLDNIESIYTTLMTMDVVRFSYSDFLNSTGCTDIDFKRDFICTEKNFDGLTSKLWASVTPSKKRGEGARAFKESNNKGIEFNERKTRAFKTKPFLKVYHKGIELTSLHTLDFTKNYLQEIDIQNIARVEATVKNKAHLRHLGIENNTLHSILSLTEEQKENIISKSVQANLEPRVQPIRTPNNMSLDKQMHYNMMVALIQRGLSYEITKQLSLSGIDRKTNRYRKGKELDEIYAQEIKGETFAIEVEEINRIFDLIGWK